MIQILVQDGTGREETPSVQRDLFPRVYAAVERSANFRHFLTLTGEAREFRTYADHAVALLAPLLRRQIAAFYGKRARRLGHSLATSGLELLDRWFANQINVLELAWPRVEAEADSSRQAAANLARGAAALETPSQVAQVLNRASRA